MSFTEAAKEVYLSQPAVSRQISTLEKEWGVQLFIRSNNTVSFTPEGQYLARNMEPLVSKMEMLLNQARKINVGFKEHLHIGLLEDQSIDEHARRILQSMSRMPVQLHIERMNYLELDYALRSDKIDLIMGVKLTPKGYEGFSRMIYSEERMCLAILESVMPDALRNAERITLDSLELDVPILRPTLDSFPIEMQREFDENIERRWDIIKQHNYSDIVPLVEAGMVAALVNESHQLAIEQGIVMIALDNSPIFEKGLFWKSDNNNPALRKLLENCRNMGLKEQL